MSAIREAQGRAQTKPATNSTQALPFAEQVMEQLSSVRFGVVLLVLLAAACMVGMLIMQANMEGFDKYYAELTPSQQLLYGSLGFFDIYHTWYFNALLLVLSLNIILSSIDFFPKSWTFISRPKLDASTHWLSGQEQHAALQVEGGDASQVAERVSAACNTLRFKTRITEKAGKTFVFAQRGAWNRLGAYAVHVGLLTIFAGGFMTAQFGHTGQVGFGPGESADEMTETAFNLDKPQQIKVALPFTVECTDIQQKLIDKQGPTSPMNTLDWLTRIKIKDPERGETEALVQMNAPFDYRGYRFFQSSFVGDGKARSIVLRVTPEAGGEAQELKLMRNEVGQLSDGTVVRFADFYSDLVLEGGRAASASADYLNPAAALQVIRSTGDAGKGFAFSAQSTGAGPMVGHAFAGYKFELVDFEKVGSAHVLSVQKDPGAGVVYLGFILLTITLVAVFLFSHQRVWAVVEEAGEHGRFNVTLGGNTNRNRLGFEDRFKRIVKTFSEQ